MKAKSLWGQKGITTEQQRQQQQQLENNIKQKESKDIYIYCIYIYMYLNIIYKAQNAIITSRFPLSWQANYNKFHFVVFARVFNQKQTSVNFV